MVIVFLLFRSTLKVDFYIMPLDRVNDVVFSKPCGTLRWVQVRRMRGVNYETLTDILYVYL